MGSRIDFYRLFISREGRELAGKRVKNVLGLLGILFITYLAIGFAEGGLDYLELKMSDPFTHWVNIPIPYTKADSITGYLEKFNDPAIKQRFNYTSVKPYSHFSQRFFDSQGNQIQVEGRTIEAQNPLLKSILSDYKLQGIRYEDADSYFRDQDVGLIVSKEFMNKLGYVDAYPPFISMVYPISNDTDLNVPLPVIAVVKQLPGMVSVMTTELFYTETQLPKVYMFLVTKPEYQDYLAYFLTEKQNALDWKDKLITMANSRWKGIIASSGIEPYRKSFQQGNCVQLNLDDTFLESGVNADEVDQFLRNTLKDGNPLIRIYHYEYGRLDREETGQDYLSVHMSSLDSITQFQQYVQDETGLEIEMAQINAKSNYNFVSKLTLITSLILIIFSIIAVSMFLSSLIKSHFEKIKKNLGTFKAFGLDNRMLTITYAAISFTFVLVASVVAYFLALLAGSIGFFRIVISLFGLSLETGYLYFNLMTQMSLYTFLIVILLSTIIVIFRLRRMLRSTPGDLIYER